ncbi:MAG TPA: patatin-like phospholipase family protein [Thermodesulfobacteriota bacterium]|nr:patatin-like phospholipase family protein [Thermodesulfobacteriota bacterium]
MKIGIALGGGIAKGFAHVGVLKALANAGVECEIISGTSIGALVGAAYAAGSLEKLEGAITKIRRKDMPILLSPTWPKRGFFSGKKVLDRLSEFIGVENIEDLKKTFAAVSVDINSSEIVTLTSGNLRQAVLASIAIPVILNPVVVDDRLLVDGGMVEPLPVQAARSLGADFVIAVDLYGEPPLRALDRAQKKARNSQQKSAVGTALKKLSLREWSGSDKKDNRLKPSIIGIIERSLIAHQRYLTEYRLKECPADFVIKPDVSCVSIVDFHRAREIVEIGGRSVKEVLPALIDKMDTG